MFTAMNFPASPAATHQVNPTYPHSATFHDQSQSQVDANLTLTPPQCHMPMSDDVDHGPTPPTMSPARERPAMRMSSFHGTQLHSPNGIGLNGSNYGVDPFTVKPEPEAYPTTKRASSRPDTPPDQTTQHSIPTYPAYSPAPHPGGLGAKAVQFPSEASRPSSAQHLDRTGMANATALIYHQAPTQMGIPSGQNLRVNHPYSSTRSTGSISPTYASRYAPTGVEGEHHKQSSDSRRDPLRGHAFGPGGGEYKHTQLGLDRSNISALRSGSGLATTIHEHQIPKPAPPVRSSFDNTNNYEPFIATSTAPMKNEFRSHSIVSNDLTTYGSTPPQHRELSLDTRFTPGPMGVSEMIPVPIDISRPVVPGTGGNWDMRTSSSVPALSFSAGTATSVSTSAATPQQSFSSLRQINGFNLQQEYSSGFQDGASSTASNSHMSLPGIASMSFDDRTREGSHNQQQQQRPSPGKMFATPPFQPFQLHPTPMPQDRKMESPRGDNATRRVANHGPMAPTFSGANFAMPGSYPQQYHLMQPARTMLYADVNGAHQDDHTGYPKAQFGTHPTQYAQILHSTNQPIILQEVNMYGNKHAQHFVLAPANQQGYSAQTFFVQPNQIQPGRFENDHPEQQGAVRLTSMPLDSHGEYDSEDFDDKGWQRETVNGNEMLGARERLVSDGDQVEIENAMPSVQIMEPPPMQQDFYHHDSSVRRTNKLTLKVVTKKLAKHRPKVTSPRNHLCPECPQTFNRPSSLRTHMTVHTKEKPHQCIRQDCLRYFSVLSNLRRHERTHDRKAAETRAALRNKGRSSHAHGSSFDGTEATQSQNESDVGADVEEDGTSYRPGRRSDRQRKRSAPQSRAFIRIKPSQPAARRLGSTSASDAGGGHSSTPALTSSAAPDLRQTLTNAQHGTFLGGPPPRSTLDANDSSQPEHNQHDFAFLPKPNLMRIQQDTASPALRFSTPLQAHGAQAMNGSNLLPGHYTQGQQGQDDPFIRLRPVQNRVGQTV